jgi:NAD(P)-dependent dehydrogenase (short-subunit alcohol dehydrogenase family)
MGRDGRVAIVTGAATGIGQASAKALDQAGFRVFGTSRRAVASAVEGITMVTCDVTDDTSVAAAVDKVLDTTGGQHRRSGKQCGHRPACRSRRIFGEPSPSVV